MGMNLVVLSVICMSYRIYSEYYGDLVRAEGEKITSLGLVQL